jgi:hypothetical protein
VQRWRNSQFINAAALHYEKKLDAWKLIQVVVLKRQSYKEESWRFWLREKVDIGQP